MNLGSFDMIQDEKDVGRSVDLPGRISNDELHRQEAWEEAPSPVELMELHCMTGHGSTSSMIQTLRTAGASSQVLEVCRHFSCETLAGRGKRFNDHLLSRSPTDWPSTMRFLVSRCMIASGIDTLSCRSFALGHSTTRHFG